MNFLKDVVNNLKNGDSIERLSIISDIIQILSFFTAIIFAPKVLSMLYKTSSDTYLGIVLVTTLSIIIILVFLIFLSLLNQCKNEFMTNTQLHTKLLYFIFHVLLWGFGIALIPGFIIFLYQIALR